MFITDVASVVLFGILLATALAITRTRSLYAAAMLAGLFSLVSASLFVLLDAVDVAFTEAAVGAGISTVLFIIALALTRSREATTPRRRVIPAGLVAVLATAGMIYASQDLPPVGDAGNPVQTHPVTTTYLEDSQDDIGVPNTVTAVLASYRGYDTLGEVVVIFTAGVGVLLLMLLIGPSNDADVPAKGANPRRLNTEYRILRVVSKTLMPFIMVFALYVLFHGEFGPGGGFQAGVIFAAGFILYGLVFGLQAVQHVLPTQVLIRLIPVGVLIYAGVGVANMMLGGSFLDYNTFVPGHPAEGQEIGIVLIEVGVGVTVAAAMVAIFYVLVNRGVRR